MSEKDVSQSAGQGLLRHFRLIAVLFAVVMLAVAGCVGWYAVNAEKIKADIADQAYQVEYNQGRVRRQIYEYQQAEEEIPKLDEQVKEIREKAEETAKAKRDQREEATTMFRGTFKGISAAKKDAKAKLEEAEAAESLAREAFDTLLQSLTGGEQP